MIVPHRKWRWTPPQGNVTVFPSSSSSEPCTPPPPRELAGSAAFSSLRFMSARLDSSLRMTTESGNALGFVRRHVEIAAPPPLLLSPSVFAGPVHGNRSPASPCSIISSLACSSEASAEMEEPTEVTKASVRAMALHFGKKALWDHNVYGFTPTIGSANHLLQYAKEHKDANLMQEVMKLLKKNNLPLQPTTVDIVFSICDDTDNWGLLTKYSKRFVKNGVNLHKAAFDIWMEFAAKVGDIESLWKTEKLRCESMKQHTVGSGFSCAKANLRRLLQSFTS